MPLTRRQFGQDTLASLVTYSLLDLLLAKGAVRLSPATEKRCISSAADSCTLRLRFYKADPRRWLEGKDEG